MQFIFKLAFEFSYLVFVFIFFKLSKKHFLWSKWNVTFTFLLGMREAQRGSGMAGHNLIRMPLKGVFCFLKCSGGEQ